MSDSTMDEPMSGLVPRLRFPEFREAGEWKVKQLGGISDIKTGPFGSVLHESDYVEVGTPIITVEHLGETEIEVKNAPKVSDSDKERLGSYILKDGDIVFSRVGSVDRSAIVKVTEEGWLFSGRLLRLRIISTDNSALFLNQLLKHEPSKALIRNSAVGQTMASLNTAILKSISLPFPCAAEQQKISACLSSLDALIAAQADKLDALKTHKKGLMQQLFPREGETVPRLRFPEFREAGEWKSKAISDLGEVVTGSTPSTTEPDYYGGDIHFVSPADISDLRFIEDTKTTLTELGFAQTRQIRANSVLFVCIGSTIGKVAQNMQDCATNQQINSVVPNSGHDGAFVYHSLVNNSGIIAELAGKQAVPIINKTLFSSVVIPFPKRKEQQRIAACLSSLDALIAAQADKLDALKTHKKGLMQQLFPTASATLTEPTP